MNSREKLLIKILAVLVLLCAAMYVNKTCSDHLNQLSENVMVLSKQYNHAIQMSNREPRQPFPTKILQEDVLREFNRILTTSNFFNNNFQITGVRFEPAQQLPVSGDADFGMKYMSYTMVDVSFKGYYDGLRAFLTEILQDGNGSVVASDLQMQQEQDQHINGSVRLNFFAEQS